MFGHYVLLCASPLVDGYDDHIFYSTEIFIFYMSALSFRVIISSSILEAKVFVNLL